MQLKTNYSFNNHSYLIHRQSKANISKYLLSSSCRAVRAESCVCLFPTTVASPTPPPPYMKHYNFAGTGARVLAAVSTQSTDIHLPWLKIIHASARNFSISDDFIPRSKYNWWLFAVPTPSAEHHHYCHNSLSSVCYCSLFWLISVTRLASFSALVFRFRSPLMGCSCVAASVDILDI